MHDFLLNDQAYEQIYRDVLTCQHPSNMKKNHRYKGLTML